ncbi:type II toxin-antitoxin system PemK/MazF family toxin [Clostridium pasteurianum]|uniref:Growth inhibitor n=1 Tax=Clostridium pasteurianum BC1 TaxID=86416 RepID=R4K3J2_CLOPA|nr:type II toxin-antitoxin system PemK/MazF family toxin [Clostridium pasteurianum]AGK97697.1 growth inhibitor [Clostridium pasteurianum BC1]
MPKHISKKQIVDNLLTEITNIIDKSNVDTAMPILKWTKEKIILSHQEVLRNQKYKTSFRKTGKPRHVKRGYIYYAKLGRNIGSEQNGYRPVLVVQDGVANITSNTVIIIPLTDAIDSKGVPKRILGTHVEIDHKNLTKKSIIKTEHVHNISKNRLIDEIGYIGDTKMNEIDMKLKISLGINI